MNRIKQLMVGLVLLVSVMAGRGAYFGSVVNSSGSTVYCWGEFIYYNGTTWSGLQGWGQTILTTLGPSGTFTFGNGTPTAQTYDASLGRGYTFYIYANTSNNLGTATLIWSKQVLPTASSPANVTYGPIEVGLGPCTTNLSWVYTYQGQYGSLAGIYDDRANNGQQQVFNAQFMSPGDVRTFSVSGIPCTDVSHFHLGTFAGGTNYVQQSNNGTNTYWVSTVTQVSASPSSASTTASQQGSGTVYDATQGTTNIVFNPTSSTNTAQAVRDASQAIYDATVKNGAEAHADASALKTAIDALGSSFGGLTNGSAYAAWTNGLTYGQLTNSYQTQYSSSTNNLQGQLDNYNWHSTNAASDLIAPKFTIMTRPQIDVLQGGVQDFGDIELGNGPNNIKITLGATAIDSKLPALMAAYVVFKWAIILILVICNYKVLVVGLRTTLLIPQARTAGTEVAGFNINSASAVIMAAAIVATAASLPTVLATGIVDTLSNISWGNPFDSISGTVGTGYNFCNHYFPVGLSIIAILNHLGFRVFANGLETVALSVVKFLVGL